MNTHARERKNPLRATEFASGKPALEVSCAFLTRLGNNLNLLYSYRPVV